MILCLLSLGDGIALFFRKRKRRELGSFFSVLQMNPDNGDRKKPVIQGFPNYLRRYFHQLQQ